MIFLKLLAPILVWVIALLQIALNMKWSERSWKQKSVTITLLFVMTLASGITVAIVVEDKQSRKELTTQLADLGTAAKAAEERELEAKQERAGLQSELETMQSKLDPFVRIAQARYPDVSSEAALRRLATNISTLRRRTTSLETETRQLASREFYRPLDTSLEAGVVAALKSVQRKYSHLRLSASAFCETGNRNRQLVAEELVAVLRSAGIETEGLATGTTFSQRAPPSINLSVHPQDTELAQDVVTALDRLFVKVQFAGTRNEELRRGTLKFAIHGDPLFSSDGSVNFK